MDKRLMSDRDHVEALIYAAENLLDQMKLSPEDTREAELRLQRAADRARQDLYPSIDNA